MSSDSSDDEFNYTNTARLLKHMTRKIRTDDGNSSFDSPNASPAKQIPLIDKVNVSESIKSVDDIIEIVEESYQIKTRCRKKNTVIQSTTDSQLKPTPEDQNCINLCSSPNQINNESTSKLDNQLEPDNDLDLNKSYDIISQIDACLARNNPGRVTRNCRGWAKRKCTAIAKAQNKKSNAGRIMLDTIEIDPDYPILNSQVTIPEDVNYDVSVKVLWKSQHLERFNLRRFQKVDHIFTYYAQKEDISEDRLFFTLKEKVVTKADTPYTLGITAASIIEGGVLSAKTFLCSAIEYSSETIELKVQIKDVKRPLMIHMNVTDQMDVLISQCAEELKVPPSRLKLYFDGDIIRPSDSPMSLEFEGGECIDCYKADNC